MRKKLITMTLILFWGLQDVTAQDIAMKTNMLSDLTTTFSIGGEMEIAPQWTMDCMVNYNPWNFAHNKKWKHWKVQPEARYWLRRNFNGHFFGVHLHGGQFNVGNWDTSFKMLGTDFSLVKDSRFEGWFVGAGLTYGYAWHLGRHWNMEADLGFGYSYTDYDRFACPTCGEKQKSGKHHYVGPTKAGVNLIYMF